MNPKQKREQNKTKQLMTSAERGDMTASTDCFSIFLFFFVLIVFAVYMFLIITFSHEHTPEEEGFRVFDFDGVTEANVVLK